MGIQVYAEQKGYQFKKIKITYHDEKGLHTVNLTDDDAHHLFEVLNGRCGVMELYDSDKPYHSPKEVVYASKILKKEGLEYIIEPR